MAVSSKASKDKINMLKCLGAEIYVCPSNVESDDPRSYYEVAKRLNKEIKGSIPKPTLIINAVAYLSASYSSNLDSFAVNKLVKKDDIYIHYY